MILRLNQIDRSAAEQITGWGDVLMPPLQADDLTDPRSPAEHTWSADTFAYELLALDQDEHDAPLALSIRSEQLRNLLPPLLSALTPGTTRLVLRLDGAFAPGELQAVLPRLPDPALVHRFAVGPVEKLWTGDQAALASVRLWPTAAGLSVICGDPTLGLRGTVRLRAFAVSEELLNPLLDTADPADERWRELLPRSAFALSTAHPFDRLVLWTKHLSPPQMKALLHEQLPKIP